MISTSAGYWTADQRDSSQDGGFVYLPPVSEVAVNDDDVLASNLARIRVRRGLSQEDLADRSGVSVGTIRKIEQRCESPRLSTLHQLATALDVTTSALITPPTELRPDDWEGEDSTLLGLRRALQPAAGTDALPVDLDSSPLDLEALKRSVVQARELYHAGDYAGLIGEVPTLIGEARVATRELTGQEQIDAYAVLAVAYQIAGHALIQIRKEDLGADAFSLGVDAARAGGHELIAADCECSLAWVFLRQRRLDDAETHCVTVADRIEPRSFRKATRVELATWGNLWLAAAMAAARNGRHAEAADLLDTARAAAVRHGPDRLDSQEVFEADFGPAKVAMRQVEAAVVSFNPKRALKLARAVPVNANVLPPAYWRHRLDVAHALADQRLAAEATRVLTELMETAPQWLRYQRYAQDIVTRLVNSRVRRLPEDLVRVADFLNVPV
ncbi:putative transcriptional regulator [Carbonactinospora thermoautotrophica]|uniref:Putative transcriptional regulator n=1 Tax=Carbonactinospora thermoautotrophica TaxID=1469144 RepID=A0A132MM81_9ACTN|nr:putative transcriptional regulator [Carbonactinospora thermoautotrophica]